MNDQLLARYLLKLSKVQRNEAKAAQKLVREQWADSLELMAGFGQEIRMIGEQYLETEYQAAADINDLVFFALMHLHANACLIFNEICSLLNSGYAGGALARWRSLHEVTVYANFIVKYGPGTAERYMKHKHIKDYEDWESLDKMLIINGGAGFTPEDVQALKDLRLSLMERFEKDFRKRTGWASNALQKADVSFDDLAADVGLDDLNAFYRIASHCIHPTWKGIEDNPGHPGVENVLLAGASEHGLWLPAMLSVRSLFHTATAFINTRPTAKWNAALDDLEGMV